MVKLNKKTVSMQGTYTEFETPYAVLHFDYIFDSGEKRIEAPSLNIGDLQHQGKNVRAISYVLVKTKQATLGEQSVSNYETIDAKETRGFHYIDGQIMREKDIRKTSRKENLKSNLEMLKNSETGALVRMRNNGYLMPFNKCDSVITWNEDGYKTVFTARTLKK